MHEQLGKQFERQPFYLFIYFLLIPRDSHKHFPTDVPVASLGV